MNDFAAVEFCVDSIDSVQAVYSAATTRPFVAVRLELCASLPQGGLTPSCGFVDATEKFLQKNSWTADLYLMVRCRPGEDYHYSDSEMQTMTSDASIFREMTDGGRWPHVKGIVFGALTPSARIDFVATRAVLSTWIAGAASRNFTFHRAVDVLLASCTVAESIEDLRQLSTIFATTAAPGAKLFLLTSGGAPTAAAGIGRLEQLLNSTPSMQLDVILGSGVTATVVDELRALLRCGATLLLHSSAKKVINAASVAECRWVVDADVAGRLLEASRSKL